MYNIVLRHNFATFCEKAKFMGPILSLCAKNMPQNYIVLQIPVTYGPSAEKT